jgi:sugar O-acyltransferase (sialic acid O-acetyltransferase NeuD family)
MTETSIRKNIKNIVIVGASGHAKVVIDIIELQKQYTIVGLLDSYKPKGFKVFNYKVLGTEGLIPELMASNTIQGGIIAIGDNSQRQKIAYKIKSIYPRFQYIIAIHPKAIIGKDVKIQVGVVVVAGVIINSPSVIEEHCIINTNASVGHDCHIKAFASIASGSTLGGHVVVESKAIVSLGAIVLNNCHIGANAIVGAGGMLTKNLKANTVAYGVPAVPIRMRKDDEPYL